jgi:hypothetical protein
MAPEPPAAANPAAAPAVTQQRYHVVAGQPFSAAAPAAAAAPALPVPAMPVVGSSPSCASESGPEPLAVAPGPSDEGSPQRAAAKKKALPSLRNPK